MKSSTQFRLNSSKECLKRVFEAVNEANGANVQEEPKSAEYGKLVELKNLLDMGIITSEEFDQKKGKF